MAIKENMKFLFKGVKIDERTEGYVRKRLNGLDRYIENILKAEVEIDKDKKGKFRVEVMLFTPRDMFRADNTTDSIEGSVDMVVDELQNQITHVNGKTETLQKKGARILKKKIVGEE